MKKLRIKNSIQKKQTDRTYKSKAMEEKKATFTNFIKYLEKNNLASERLLNILKGLQGSLYDFNVKREFENITDIEDYTFMQVRNVGKITLEEFKKLRTDFLQNIDSVTFYEIPRELYSCWIRSDISKTLQTIKDERDFIEVALLEKFERDGIELLELKEDN